MIVDDFSIAWEKPELSNFIKHNRLSFQYIEYVGYQFFEQ